MASLISHRIPPDTMPGMEIKLDSLSFSFRFLCVRPNLFLQTDILFSEHQLISPAEKTRRRLSLAPLHGKLTSSILTNL
jgi:hypothetical protein